MMTATYLLNVVLMLALVAGMAVAALWLWRKVQPGGGFGRRESAVRVVDAIPIGAAGRLAVIEFDERRFLVAVSRAGVQTIAEGPAPILVPEDEA